MGVVVVILRLPFWNSGLIAERDTDSGERGVVVGFDDNDRGLWVGMQVEE